MAEVLHPITFLVTAQVVTTGSAVSFTLIVCTQVLIFPQASLMVHVLVTTVGHVPTATSI